MLWQKLRIKEEHIQQVIKLWTNIYEIKQELFIEKSLNSLLSMYLISQRIENYIFNQKNNYI